MAAGLQTLQTNRTVHLTALLLLCIFILAAGCLFTAAITGSEKEIVVKDKYEVPPQEKYGHETYVIVDTAGTKYTINDAGYPENMHVFDAFTMGERYGVWTDGKTIYTVTKHPENLVFDQKSIRLQDGTWVRDEKEINRMLRDGDIRDPSAVEWTVRGYWTSLRYDVSPELWQKVKVYSPAKGWQYTEAPVKYHCFVGQKKVYSWRPESYSYIYSIDNIGEYDRYYASAAVPAPVTTVPVPPATTPAATKAPVTVTKTLAPATPAGDLLVSYDFEDTFIENGTVIDRSGSGRDATVTGTVRSGTGIAGTKGITFNGVGYLLAPDNPAAGKSSVTFSFWFRTDDPTQNYKFAGAAEWRGGPGTGWTMATHRPEFWADDGHDDLLVPAQPNTDNGFVPGVWTHEAVVYDGKTMKEYTNGTLINRWQARGVPMSAGVPMAVGGWPQFAGYNYVGDMDDFRIYDRAMSAAEIAKIVAAGRS